MSEQSLHDRKVCVFDFLVHLEDNLKPLIGELGQHSVVSGESEHTVDLSGVLIHYCALQGEVKKVTSCSISAKANLAVGSEGLPRGLPILTVVEDFVQLVDDCVTTQYSVEVLELAAKTHFLEFFVCRVGQGDPHVGVWLLNQLFCEVEC